MDFLPADSVWAVAASEHDKTLPLQHLPYSPPDPSYEFASAVDVLEPIQVKPYQPQNFLREQRDHIGKQAARSHEKREALLSRFDSNDQGTSSVEPVYKPFTQDEAFNRFPASYETINTKSAEVRVLEEEVENTLANAYIFDPRALSVRPARENASSSNPVRNYEQLTPQETEWIKSLKMSRIEAFRKERKDDDINARQCLTWENFTPGDSRSKLDLHTQTPVLDDLYGPGDITSRVINGGGSDEGFNEPNVATAWLSMPPRPFSIEAQKSAEPTAGPSKAPDSELDDGFNDVPHPRTPPNTPVSTVSSSLRQFNLSTPKVAHDISHLQPTPGQIVPRLEPIVLIPSIGTGKWAQPKKACGTKPLKNPRGRPRSNPAGGSSTRGEATQTGGDGRASDIPIVLETGEESIADALKRQRSFVRAVDRGIGMGQKRRRYA